MGQRLSVARIGRYPRKKERVVAELMHHFPSISVRVAGSVTAEIRKDPFRSSHAIVQVVECLMNE